MDNTNEVRKVFGNKFSLYNSQGGANSPGGRRHQGFRGGAGWQRGGVRGAGPGGFNTSSDGRTNTSPYCPGCKYLGSQLNLEVKFDHLPADCPRKKAIINLVHGETETNDVNDTNYTNNDLNYFMNELNKETDSYVRLLNYQTERHKEMKTLQLAHILESYQCPSSENFSI